MVGVCRHFLELWMPADFAYLSSCECLYATDTSHYENVPFEVPEGWCWCKLEDIVYITNGSTLDKSEELTSGEIPYIKVGDMNIPGNEIEILSSNAYLNDVKTVISIPSIIFPKRGGAILTNKKRKVVNQPIWIDLNIMAVTAIDNNTFDYIWTWFSQLDLSTLCNGGNIPQINTPDIANLLFPLPPIKEQKQIVFETAKWLALVASLDESKQSVGTIIKMAKSKILDLAIHGKLVPQDPTDEPALELLKRINPKVNISCDNPHYEQVLFEIPSNWVWATLGDITNYGKCSTVPVDDIDEESWVLELEDIEKDSAKVIKLCTKSDRDIKGVRHSFLQGYVLYSKLRTYLNKVLVANKDGFCTTEIIPIKCSSAVIPNYLCNVLRAPYFLDYTAQCGYGVKMPRLSTSDARKALIPLPPINEQIKICNTIEILSSNIDRIVKELG